MRCATDSCTNTGSQTFDSGCWHRVDRALAEIELRFRSNAFLILLLLSEQSGGRAAGEAESARWIFSIKLARDTEGRAKLLSKLQPAGLLRSSQMKQALSRFFSSMSLADRLNGIFDKQEGSVLVNNTRGLLSSEELLSPASQRSLAGCRCPFHREFQFVNVT